MADVPLNFTGKKYGANLTSKPGHPLESDYWAEWDWTGWMRPQIDYAMSLGASIIRLIGDVTVVNSGTITQGTYNARWQQLAAYCAANGIMLYYTGCATYGTDGSDNGTSALSAATIAGIINSSIIAITSGANDYTAWIIGADLIQEANALNDVTKVGAVYGLVKPNVPAQIGCTFSTSDPTNTSWTASIIASCDYLDLHQYPQVLGIGNEQTPTDITNGVRTVYPTKDVFFGEGGADFTAYTSGQVTNWYAGLFTLANMADAHVRGCMPWAMQDQQTSTQHYGAFDASWAPRSAIILPWVRGLGGAGGTPATPTQLRVVNNRLVWNPTGCSNAWDSTKLYRNGSQIANPIYCLYDDSAAWTGAQFRYQVSAVAGGTESAKSPVFYYPGGLGWLRTA
jgi:hypothetical protein